jgi:hypothetical protein
LVSFRYYHAHTPGNDFRVGNRIRETAPAGRAPCPAGVTGCRILNFESGCTSVHAGAVPGTPRLRRPHNFSSPGWGSRCGSGNETGRPEAGVPRFGPGPLRRASPGGHPDARVFGLWVWADAPRTPPGRRRAGGHPLADGPVPTVRPAVPLAGAAGRGGVPARIPRRRVVLLPPARTAAPRRARRAPDCGGRGG